MTRLRSLTTLVKWGSPWNQSDLLNALLSLKTVLEGESVKVDTQDARIGR